MNSNWLADWEARHEDESMCNCPRSLNPECTNPGTELHSCPYIADVNDDEKFQYNCCETCRRECLDEI